MADTYTSTLGVILMGIGGDNNTWGTNLNNAVFQIFEDAIANALSSAVTGGTLDLSANPPPAGPSQARFETLIFTGTLAANQVVKVPNLIKKWRVVNACTLGAFTLSMQTPSGSAVTIPPGAGEVRCDGANTITVSPFNSNQVQMPDGSAAAPSYSFANGASSGWYRAGVQDIRLSVGGADVLQVTGGGASPPSVVNVLSPNVLQQAGNPMVSGPGSSTVGDFVLWNAANGTLVKDGGAPGALAAANTVTTALLAPGAAPLGSVFNPQTVGGDNLSLFFSSANTIAVTVGRVRDDSDATNLHIATNIWKRLDTAWASGGASSGAAIGACDSGTQGANQTWHIFLIGKLALAPTTWSRSGSTVTLNFASAHGLGAGATVRVVGIGAGVDAIAVITSATTTSLSYTRGSGAVATTAVPAGATADGFDVLASQSYLSPLLPSGWGVRQCLGSVLTDGGGNIQSFTQLGDYFQLTTSVNNGTGLSSGSRVAQGVAVPTGVSVHAHFSASLIANSTTQEPSVKFTNLNATDEAPSSTNCDLALAQTSATNVGANWSGLASAQCWCRSNTSAQIGFRMTGGGSISIQTLGWRDPRRRLF